MNPLQSFSRRKKSAEASLQKFGRTIRKSLDERAKRNKNKGQDYFKKTGSYPG